MRILYKNRAVERTLVVFNAAIAAVIVATFVLLFGFEEPIFPERLLHIVQISAFFALIFEKLARFVNASSKRQFIKASWFEVPLLIGLCIGVLGAGRWFAFENPGYMHMFSLGLYLVIQVIAKACVGCVNVAASGRNPTVALLIIFLVLILSGGGTLMLPRAYNCESMTITDAIFTSTSAACVTGLVVRDTGQDFSLTGQIVILTLIQLGGLGIVIFGAVLALLLGQALSVRESVAMQDLLSSRTLGRIGNMIGFIFMATIVIEAVGAVGLLNTWESVPDVAENIRRQWFFSIFHSISAFCNAGFSLCSDNLEGAKEHLSVYGVIAPLIMLGGLGFGVMYNIAGVWMDKARRLFHRLRNPGLVFEPSIPRRITLQTKVVLTTTILLIIIGMLAFMIFGTNDSQSVWVNAGDAFFQSVTARTAGFNTVDIGEMSSASKMVMITLMFIGGSPGSTAGGIKTVTLAVILMVAWATFKKRSKVEVFRRSVGQAVVGRAITVLVLFTIVLFVMTLALAITEEDMGFAMSDIMFEAGSALGTVGLSTGITSSLTTAGKWIIIVTMLIGRLGPLTLLAAMTFNLRPARYEYPQEPIIVG